MFIPALPLRHSQCLHLASRVLLPVWPFEPKPESDSGTLQHIPKGTFSTLGPDAAYVSPPNPTLEPALVSVPEHTVELSSGDLNPVSLSSTSLAPLPVSSQEPARSSVGSFPDSPDCSGSLGHQRGSQPMHELVLATCKPLVPTSTLVDDLL